MCNFGGGGGPEPPPQISPPEMDPEELARRRLAADKRAIGRDDLVINQGATTQGKKDGTGLRIGG